MFLLCCFKDLHFYIQNANLQFFCDLLSLEPYFIIPLRFYDHFCPLRSGYLAMFIPPLSQGVADELYGADR